jgi:hypothetical protein
LRKGQQWRSVAAIAVHEGKISRGWERPVTPYTAREGGKVGCTRSKATRKLTADLDGRGKGDHLPLRALKERLQLSIIDTASPITEDVE